MTEVKWAILFVALFLCTILGLEFRNAFYKQILYSEQNLNIQLDTSLEDALEQITFVMDEGIRFASAEAAGRILKENLKQGLQVTQGREEKFCEAIRFVVLYEKSGFYFYGAKSGKWKWYSYDGESLAERMEQMECLMEKENGRCYTFPQSTEDKFANTLAGTGVLLAFEPPAESFLGVNYHRLILSGAKIEKMW